MTVNFPFRKPLTAALMMTLALGLPSLAAAQQLVPLVTDQTPLSLPTTFGVPSGGFVNQAGDHVFLGSDNQAIFLRRAGAPSTVRVFQMGEEVPGFPGSRADQIGSPLINNAGLVAFRVDTFRINGRATAVILTFDGTTLVPVVSGVDAAPGGSGALFERGISLQGLNDAGDLLFAAPLVPSNSGVPSQTTLFIKPAGGAPVRLVGLGDVAPGTGGETITSFAFLGRDGFNNAGQVFFSASLTGAAGNRGLFVVSTAGVRKVVAQGDPDPLGGVFNLPATGKLNNAGQTTFAADGRLWLNTAATGNTCVLNSGAAVPAPLGGTFNGNLTVQALNDAGEVAFTATNLVGALGNNGLFRYRPSNPLELVAYRNQAVPGIPGRSFADFQAVSINSSGLISFRATDTTSAVAGMFQQIGAALPSLFVLNSEAATLPGGGTYSLLNASQTLDSGALYFRADIAGGAADYGEFLRSAGSTINLMNNADALPAGGRIVTRTFRLGAAGNYVAFFMQYAGGKTSIGVHNITTQASEIVVKDGEIAPGSGGGRIRLTNSSSVFVNGNGTVVFSANIAGGGPGIANGIYLAAAGAGLSKVVLNLDPDPSGGTVGNALLNGVTRSPINDAGQVVFINTQLGKLFVWSGGSPVRIASVGASLPGIGTVTSFSFTGDFHINASGDVTFVANSATGSGLYFVPSGGSPVKVAAVGDAAPGGGTFNGFTQPVLNSNDEIVFGAALTGGSAVRGVFLRTAGASLVSVARDGDPAPGGGTFEFTDALRDVALNDLQDLVFRANVSGGSSNSGYFVRRGLLAPIEPLLLQGQAAPGTSRAFATVVGGLNGLAREDIQLGPEGDVAIQAAFVDADGLRTAGIWHAKTDNTLEVIVIRADVDVEFGGGSALITTPGGQWNSGRRFPITARISGGTFTDGIFLFVPTTTVPTPEGSNITVVPPDSTTGTTPVTMSFSDVAEPGETSVTTSAAGPTVPTAFQIGDPPVFYNLETTAVFNGAITVCVDFTGVNFPNGTPLALLHFENGAWQDVTTSGPTNNVICGSVTSLSPFTVAQVLNRDPVANAGLDQTVECCGPNGATVTLNGTGSSDPDFDTLTYVWTDSSDVVVGNTASVALTLSRGTYTFTLTVTDPHGFSSSAVTHVAVQDTLAPTLAVTVSPDVILPPNNKLVTVTAAISVSDVCDANPHVELVSITSNEALASGDVQGAAFGTDDRTFQLRATRSGNGAGRIYTITYRVTDAAGNSTSQQVRCGA